MVSEHLPKTDVPSKAMSIPAVLNNNNFIPAAAERNKLTSKLTSNWTT